MCGICGYLDIKEKKRKKSSKDVIKDMCNSLFRRGPDDSGTYKEKKAAIAMRRLSIIDLDNGHQPIFNEKKDKCIVFNGEIYNFKELHELLVRKGHSLKTNSDTEVILHLYEEYGKDCVKKLEGMFAFCIYDKKEKSMFLARDRIGKKPLHYYMDDKIFVFSSEIKSLLKHPSVSRDIDPSSIKKYFMYGYVPAPGSIFKKIKKLCAGHHIFVDANRFSIEKYWDINFSKKKNISKDRIKKKTLELLNESIKKRLISDVPLGVFLSGGIDSSLITALMSKIKNPKEINTFTIGFEENSFDESVYAEEVAKLLGTKHKTKTISCEYALRKIPEILDYIDEPMSDPSVIPTYLLSEFAREHIKVALGGDGGDELFGGYPKYYMHGIADIYSRSPGFLDNVFGLIPASQNSSYFNYKIKKFAQGSRYNRDIRNQLWVGAFFPEEIDMLLSDEIKRHIADSKETYGQEASRYLKTDIKDKKNRMMFLDLKLTLQDMFLVKVDRMSMANSLEVRNPLLDHKLVEFCFSLSSKHKVSLFSTKKLLKEIALDYLPEDIVNRKKTGFGIPLARWLRKDLKKLVSDTLSKQKIEQQGIFNYASIKKMVKEHRNRTADHSIKIWSLVIFQLWLDRYNPLLPSMPDPPITKTHQRGGLVG